MGGGGGWGVCRIFGDGNEKRNIEFSKPLLPLRCSSRL